MNCSAAILGFTAVMKAGGKTYFPVTSDSEVGAGSIVDINNVSIVELAKSGENNIIRLKVK